ncbi:putative ABC transport system permease protein [Algoriphagus sp. 4150]|uniref:ABC transporter permease n=1 Tax=Algoriphagus sp. 4150 TaxID=2817756 RepID=UPI00285C8599|nr:ABC transporter permease [Algoriphagus sp. 4150]MDR7130843.1 putative ABC transport system permease protein [Algoriphagus sp. 4150]
MNIFLLSIKNIASKPLSTGLSLILLALGVGLISLMLHIDRHLQTQMSNNIRGIDMVVGAKGSPLQLILSAVFQVDVPTGNIKLSEAQILQKNRLVEYGIPLSYGDSYESFRIVGTTDKYPEIYSMEIADGRIWDSSLEVAIGATVAEKTGLKVGDSFLGSHGLSEGGHVHEDQFYVVKGIFHPSGSVIDQLILTGLESVWDIHDNHSDHPSEESHGEKHPDDGEPTDGDHAHHAGEVNSESAHSDDHEDHEGHSHDAHEEEREITAMLVKFRNPMGMVQLPRMINEKTNMQAALPNYELLKLFSLMGIATTTLNMVAFIVILVSGISVFISLYLSLKGRTYEMALLRTYGASRMQLLSMVFQEGLLVAFAGFALGILFSRIGLGIISVLLKSDYRYEFADMGLIKGEGYLLLITLCIGFFSALIPAITVFKIDLSKSLSDA